MPFRSSLTLAALLAVAGCASSPSVLDCSEDAACGTGNVCIEGACVVNAPPIADFDAPVAATTHRLYSLVPSSSDPEGRGVTHGWSVKASSGGCEPDVEPSVGGALDVVFWCAGTYEVTLVPVDDLGLSGAAAVRAFEVTAATGAPNVTVGPSIAAPHTCDQDVPACVVMGPGDSTTLSLGAVAEDPAGLPITFEWKGLPPPAPAADPSLLLTFVPSEAIAAPIVAIANGSGGPIAGLYRFRVRVRNSEGLLGQAFQELVVGNEAPVAALGSPLLPHGYADGRFVAEGDVAVGASDPDGDALVVESSLAPAPPTDCLEEVEASTVPGALHVRIDCSAAGSLIGATPRTLTVIISDSNGATASFERSLAIDNHPPQIVLGPAFTGDVLQVDHRVEACQLAKTPRCYVADGANPFVAIDPDGDPVTELLLAATVAADRTLSRGWASVADGVSGFRFETPELHPLEFRSATGVTGFTLSGSAVDPFGARGSATRPLLVANRPPIVKEAVAAISINHSYDVASRRYVATADAALFEDPDGDPFIPPTITPAGSCTSVTLLNGRVSITCARSWDYALGGVPPLASFLVAGGLQVATSDGWEPVSTGTYVTILDRPATVSIPVTTLDSCVCSGLLFVPSGLNATVPVTLVDPDGDPSLVSALSLFDPHPSPSICFPGGCATITDIASAGTTVTVTADSGAPGAHPSVEVGLSVYCSKMGQGC